MDSSAVYVVALHVVRHVFDNSGKALAILIAVCIVLFYVVFVLVASRRLLRRVFGPPRPPWEFDLDEIPSWLLLDNVLRHKINIPLKTASPVVSWLVEHHWDKMQQAPLSRYDFVRYGNSRHHDRFIFNEKHFPVWFDGNNAVNAFLWKGFYSGRPGVTLSSNSSKAMHDCMRHLQLDATSMRGCLFEMCKYVGDKFLGELSRSKLENLFFDDKEMLMRKLQDFKLGCGNGQFKRLGILIHGDGGTGKTALIAALANYLRRDVYHYDVSAFFSDPKMMFRASPHPPYAPLNYLSCIEYLSATSLPTSKTNPYCEALVAMDERARDHVRESPKQTGADLRPFMRCWEMFQQSGDSVVVTEVDYLSCVHPALLQPGFFDTVIHMRKASHTMLRDIIANVYDEAVELERVQRIPERVWAPSDVIEASLRHPDAESLIAYLERCDDRSDIFRCRQ